MSTRHLRALVETARESARSHAMGTDALSIIARAEEELRAIEAAAVSWSSRGTVVPGDQMRNFWTLLESIAKDAP